MSNTEYARMSFTIGRFGARRFRRLLRYWGLFFNEDRGWANSFFVVTARYDVLEAFRQENSDESHVIETTYPHGIEIW